MLRATLALLVLLGLAACAERPPNLVLVIGDDQGWRDHGFMGNARVRTPRLDALAAEGTLYTHAFNTASSCRPALRSLLSGLHPVAWEERVRLLLRRRAISRDTELVRRLDTLPRVLARHGYASFQGGKHWEGSFADAGFTHGLSPDRPPAADLENLSGEEVRALSGGDAALALGRETMEPLWRFLEAHRDQPFFVWFAPALPHRPHDAGPGFRALYADAPLTRAARAYYANISRLDARVGELLDRLDALGLADDTVVLYLSDNGWDQPPDRGLASFSGGARGKHTLYELGFRTPLVVRWPGRVAAGAVRDDLVSSVDVFATLLDLAGAEPPPGRTGRSLWPALAEGARWPRDRVIGGVDRLQPPGGGWPEASRGWFLRTAAWRYLWFEDAGVEALYAIERDPREQRDVSAREPARVAAFRREIVDWRERVTRLARDIEDAPPP